MPGQNILTGSKLCLEAIFRQGEIFSMDDNGGTVNHRSEQQTVCASNILCVHAT